MSGEPCYDAGEAMYRDELEAARSRIAVLENALQERESQSPYSQELRAQRAVAEARLKRFKDGRKRRPLHLVAILLVLSVLGLTYYLLASERIALAPAMFSGVFIPFLLLLSRAGPSPAEREAEANVARLDLALAAEKTKTNEAADVRVAESTLEASDDEMDDAAAASARART